MRAGFLSGACIKGSFKTMKAMRKLLVTGSSGLIGSEVATYFSHRGWDVHGVDNNMRAFFFGPEGDTRWNQRRLQETLPRFTHHELDIRDRQGVLELIETLRPDAVVHAAAQPSHDKAAQIPFEDFDVNAVGTLNLLEATRRYAPEAVFVHMSTNKVYGDAPNELPLVELEKRWDYADPAYYKGIPETFRIDQSKHSIFGASKVAADIMVQEYGRYFGMKTCCLRGGCLTGPNHSGVELHGFLSYLIKCNLTSRKYTIYGYKGKQVRDNIHSYDVARFIECFLEEPRVAEVYNLGGGRENSCSILEAFEMIEALSGKKMIYDYVDKPREGDHICYISDLTKMKTHYPQWDITKKLPEIFEEIYRGWMEREKAQRKVA
jgi:CDP-paratose 2-epimerase